MVQGRVNRLMVEMRQAAAREEVEGGIPEVDLSDGAGDGTSNAIIRIRAALCLIFVRSDFAGVPWFDCLQEPT